MFKFLKIITLKKMLPLPPSPETSQSPFYVSIFSCTDVVTSVSWINLQCLFFMAGEKPEILWWKIQLIKWMRHTIMMLSTYLLCRWHLEVALTVFFYHTLQRFSWKMTSSNTSESVKNNAFKGMGNTLRGSNIYVSFTIFI